MYFTTAHPSTISSDVFVIQFTWKPSEVEESNLTPRKGTARVLFAPFLGERKGALILERFHIVNIVVEDKQNAYRQVNELLHEFADVIRLRVGYPVPDENVALILLVLKANNDTVGSLSGKLGQVRGVKVRTMPIR